MKGRTPTAAEKKWMDAARSLGCIVCIERGTIRPHEISPEYTAIHHIDGKTKPDAHFLTIPLCPCHHQTSVEAFHVDPSGFQKRNGSQMDLLFRTKLLIGGSLC